MKRKPFEERIVGTLTETLAALREGAPLEVVERHSGEVRGEVPGSVARTAPARRRTPSP